MKRIILFLALCLQARAAITLVNKAENDSASGSSIAIAAMSATAGNTLLVFVRCGNSNHPVQKGYLPK